MDEYLTKKQRRELRKKEKEGAMMHGGKSKQRTRFVLILSVVLILGGGIAWFLKSQSTSSQSAQENEVVSENGLHWHANLGMYANNNKLDIPKDIGIGRIHLPVHTHEADGVIHMEFSGRVTRDDLKLKKFFQNWGKDMRKDFGTLSAMKTNGAENMEFGEYTMKDKDTIELRYQ